MSKIRWTGNALAVTQINNVVFSGTWATNDTVTATINGKAIVTTILEGSPTPTTVATDVAAALAASTILEFAEVTWTSATATLTGTMGTAGIPFSVTFTKTSTSGLIDGGASSTGTDAPAASGPNFWSTAANWSGGAVPVSGDDVYFDNSTVSVQYGMAQSAVLLSSLTFSLSYTGDIGLPKTNPAGYNEYRADYLAIGFGTNFLLKVGTDTGTGSGRIKINAGSTKCFIEVTNTGTGAETGLGALLFKGTHANNTLEVKNGEADVGAFGGELATIDNFKQTGGTVRFGADVTWNTAVLGAGTFNASTQPSSTVASWTQEGGSARILGACALTAGTVIGGTFGYDSSGTIGALAIGPGTWDRQDASPVTSTATTLNPGAVINDPFRAITHTAIAKGTNVLTLAAN